MRVVPSSRRPKGSLKWLQIAVNRAPKVLAFDNGPTVEWLSPLASDDYAEYRDDLFLTRLGLGRLAAPLSDFWPVRGGPQWDALGRRGEQVVLVESKAHVAEFFSPPCAAAGPSRHRIAAAFAETKVALGAKPRASWADCFYQYANRLAHLYFLRRQGIDAHLLLVGFVGDNETRGPASTAEWDVAYKSANYVLGLAARHPMSAYVHHVHPQVSELILQV